MANRVRPKPEDILWPMTERTVEAINYNFDLLFRDLQLSDEKVLPVTSGGTGLTGFTKGDLLVATKPTVLSPLPDVALNNVLLSGGIGQPPTYGKVGLTTHVSGILPIANGGTNAATAVAAFDNLAPTSALGDLIVHDGTDNVRLPVGPSGFVLFADETDAQGIAWKRLPGTSLQDRFLRAAASAAPATYRQLTEGHATGADTTLTFAALADGDTLLEEWVTDAGDPSLDFLVDGLYHLHVHALRSAGTKVTHLWFEVYKRTDPGGVETLLVTSEHSVALTGVEVDYDIEVAADEIDIDQTDRLVVKLYAHVHAGGAAPTVQVLIEGDTYSRFEYPVSAGGGGGATVDDGDILSNVLLLMGG